jgi:regulator of cell morphogenesis and NO signaling
MTIRDIVADDFRAAAVFQRHGIDFCCKGNRSVEEACRDGSVNAERILEEVADATAAPASGGPRFGSWDLGMLAVYIVANHHAFVRQALPILQTHTKKIAAVHGAAHPELREVAALIDGISAEMASHMMKEEEILFPYVTGLEPAARGEAPHPSAPFSTVSSPIRMMEMEHEAVGDATARIRALTDGYRVPADACTTYRICLQELEAFERDLHEHVHLENNILFPKAKRLESEIRQAGG